MLDDEKRLTDQSFNFREIEDVPHDSNSGYHSIYFSLYAIGKTNLLELPETSYLMKMLCDHTINYLIDQKK